MINLKRIIVPMKTKVIKILERLIWSLFIGCLLRKWSSNLK